MRERGSRWSYGVEVLPKERVSDGAAVPRAIARPGGVLLQWGGRALDVLRVVVDIALIVWLASGFVFTALWILALVVSTVSAMTEG